MFTEQAHSLVAISSLGRYGESLGDTCETIHEAVGRLGVDPRDQRHPILHRDTRVRRSNLGLAHASHSGKGSHHDDLRSGEFTSQSRH
jgi:hypothetical protein